MKKRAFYIMTVMTLVLLFSGCGGGQAQTQPAGTQAAAAQTEETQAGEAGASGTQAAKDAVSDLQAAKGAAFTTGSDIKEEEENNFLTEDLYDGIIRDEKDAEKALRGLFGRLDLHPAE